MTKRERQYKHILASALESGKSEDEATRIAAATTNKFRAKLAAEGGVPLVTEGGSRRQWYPGKESMMKRRKKLVGRRKLFSRHVNKPGDAFLRRNAKTWKKRHPSKDGWVLSPPIPGAQVHSTVYVAKTQPHKFGYGDLHPGFAVFSSRAKAVAGNPEHALVYMDRAEDMARFVRLHADDYRVVSLVHLPEVGRKLHGRYGVR